MKRYISILVLTAVAVMSLTASSKERPTVTIEPPYWWTGMVQDTLQLMITGKNISSANVSTDYPGIKIIETTGAESPNYLFVYLTISPATPVGTIDLQFHQGKKHWTIPYTLKERTLPADAYKGFDASDVLYLIMPDRFADGDTTNNVCATALSYPVAVDRNDPNGRHGGDIKGIRDHLDYIDSLGVTAVWVNPVLTNDIPGGSYHGYATTDYYAIDPRFGSNDEWRELIADCHSRGIKVVMDMIFNHVGYTHRWIDDMPFHDWFNHPDAFEQTNFRLSTLHDPYVSDYDLDKTVNGWFVEGMPDLNQRNPHLMKYLIQNSIWWIEDSKIDGIRMDTYPYADMNAMSGWITDIEREYPGYNIVGECWYGSEGGEAFWQRGSKVNPTDTNLPTVMDFVLSITGRQAFTEQTDPWNGLNKIYDHLALDYLFPDPQHILTFLDNHDTDRFLLEMPDSLGSWKQAQTFLLTSRGIPQIYYGTELLMNGSKEGSDGYVRRDMPGGFTGDTINAFTNSGLSPLQQEATAFLIRLLNWRKGEANDVIAHGSLKHFMPQHGIYVYRRKLGDREIHVLMNGNDSPITVAMNRTAEILPTGTVMRDILSGRDITIEDEMTFAPREILILQNF